MLPKRRSIALATKKLFDTRVRDDEMASLDDTLNYYFQVNFKKVDKLLAA